MSLAPRVVTIHRRTEYTELLERHGTAGQAAFFLAARDVDLATIEHRHRGQQQALRTVSASIPIDWRRGAVERADLAQFLFAPEDIIVVVGQDGLVPNVAKYLQGQPVIGLWAGDAPGMLCRHHPTELAEMLRPVLRGTVAGEQRTMVEATADDGQRLLALNEVYLGHPSHQTSRYRLAAGGRAERQASSGVIVASGTGATGWYGSIHQERHSALPAPGPIENRLGWFVREAWPSADTGTGLTEGLIADEPLRIQIESDSLVAFGDGMESDSIRLTRGQQLAVAVARQQLNLVS